MNFAAVKQLAELLPQLGLTSLSYEDAEFKLTLSKSGEREAKLAYAAAPVSVESLEPTAQEVSADLVTVVAPVVGTAYRSREPGKPPIAALGDTVSKGDALCVIEAMKIFSEIPAPCSGTVVEISFTDGQLAEFGSKLMVLKRSDSEGLR